MTDRDLIRLMEGLAESIRQDRLPDDLLHKVQELDPDRIASLPGYWPEWMDYIKYMNPDPYARPGIIESLRIELERLGDLPS
ncbi:MAG: hypothetical protein DWQ07_09230 [Chloroflexi bacterium]|nr:MAG: hypothetical protein DWQ07_09230 [Chloroflexota bacterium]MBL1193105.1 hypothetical protein [Chloroflexota bacterium]NOH10398.1 hypothetical protein [Chloroflexota bacterium]